MQMKIHFTILSLFIVITLFANPTYIPSYDQNVTVTVYGRDVLRQYRAGANSFIFQLTEKGTEIYANSIPLVEIVEQCKQTSQPISLILRGKVDAKKVAKIIKPLNERIFYKQISTKWPTSVDILSTKRNILIFYDLVGSLANAYPIKENIFSATSLNISSNKYTTSIEGNLINDLAIYAPTQTKKTDFQLLNECILFWKHYGKVPHFLLTKDSLIIQTRKVANILNAKLRIVGIVTLKGEKLAGVGCIEQPNSILNGRFSFPNKHRIAITLRKEGYQFVPDIALQFTDSKIIDREFEAYRTPIERNLVVHFMFENGFSNDLNPNYSAISKQVEITSDGKTGNAAHFTEGSSISLENSPLTDSIKQLSFSAWISPDSLKGAQGIFTLGKSISIKLNNKKIYFTIVDLDDIVSIQTPITAGKWQQLAVVYNNGIITYFVNGKLVDRAKTNIPIPISKGDILIGNNIWGQSFIGSMDEVKIWSRALTERDIKTIYETKPPHFIDSRTILFLIILLSIIFISVFFYLKKRKRPNSTTTNSFNGTRVRTDLNEMITPTLSISEESIHFFGKFEITNRLNQNFSSKFFPKIQQLFILIAIYTVDKNGISATEINELLWSDVSTEKATNARGTSIQKIRTILKNFDGIRIELIDKNWHIVTDSYFDYQIFSRLYTELRHEIRSEQVDKSTLIEFIKLVNKKPFLPNINAQWLDEVKASVTEKTINILFDAYQLVKNDYILCIDISDALFTFDDLNEEALDIKITCYLKQGKTKLAQSVYDKFSRKYLEIMRTPFEKKIEQFTIYT